MRLEGMSTMQSVSAPPADTNVNARQTLRFHNPASSPLQRREEPVFSRGQRVLYQARTHNMNYPGTVVAKMPTGWRVQLDCGSIKDVNDHEANRLQPVS